MYPHFTTATDTDLVKHVFSCVADVILNEVLKTTGLQWSWSTHHSGFNGFFYIWRELFWVCTFQSSLNRIFPALYDVSELYYKKTEKKSSNCNGFVQFSWKLLWFDEFFWLKKNHFTAFFWGLRCLKITQNVAFCIFCILAFSTNVGPILKMTCLVTLFDHKLKFCKNSPNWPFWANLMKFCPFKM